MWPVEIFVVVWSGWWKGIGAVLINRQMSDGDWLESFVILEGMD